MPLISAAQEGGSLNLILDGTAHGSTLRESQSDWSGWGADDAPKSSASMYARPQDDQAGEILKTLALGFQFAGTKVDQSEAGLLRMVDSKMQRLYAGDDADKGSHAVTIGNIRANGDFLTVSGSFVGQMGPSENYGRDVDLSKAVQLSGTFDVVLGPVE